VVSLVCGILLADRASAKSDKSKPNKVSSDLRGRNSGGDQIDVIIQLNDKPSGQLNALLNQNGVHVRKQLKMLNTLVVSLPVHEIEKVAEFNEVSFISPERTVNVDGHVSQTTGAAYRRDQVSSTGTPYTLDGSGVGIAIFDSGIFAAHRSLQNSSGYSRVVYSKDFTGEGRTDDPYGHGTHVASIAAGNKLYYNAAYSGIALNAKIINLRVLNSNGQGQLSSLLEAIDWLLANRTTYNVRVANMSLGMAAIDSYRDDPLCKAVRRLVDAGVTVFASAGNDGKTAQARSSVEFIHLVTSHPLLRSVLPIPLVPRTDRMMELQPSAPVVPLAATRRMPRVLSITTIY